MLNTHGFIGYFEGKSEIPYTVEVKHPATLWGATSLVDTNPSNEVDVFNASRYGELVDHPMMYSKPDYTQFNVEGMDIVISVYSPTGKFKAADLTEETEKFMRAQKKFLGKFNANKKYTVLLYLSDMKAKDAKGFGFGFPAAAFFFQSSKLSLESFLRMISVTSLSVRPNSSLITSKGFFSS